jgi:hypothetical protein
MSPAPRRNFISLLLTPPPRQKFIRNRHLAYFAVIVPIPLKGARRSRRLNAGHPQNVKCSRHPSALEKTEKNIDGLVRKAQSGKFGPKAEIVVGSVTNSWRARDVVQESGAGFHGSLSQCVGYGVLFGVAARIHVVFRVKAGCGKRDTMRCSERRQK